MEYLADTVVLIRHFVKADKLPLKVRSILSEVDNGQGVIWISVVSLMEILYLAEKNKINLNLQQAIEEIERSKNYKVIDLTVSIIKVANEIKDLELHDRLIAATAKYLGMPLLTSDKQIIESRQVDTIWK